MPAGTSIVNVPSEAVVATIDLSAVATLIPTMPLSPAVPSRFVAIVTLPETVMVSDGPGSALFAVRAFSAFARLHLIV